MLTACRSDDVMTHVFRALPPWKNCIFASFKDKSSDLEARCYGLYQITVPMHAGGRDDSIDSASMSLQPRTVALLGTQDLCMPVLETNLRLGGYTQEKLRGCKGTVLRYFGSCSIAWWPTDVRNMSCCLAWKRVLRTPFFTPSGIQHTLSRRKWHCAIIYIQIARSRNTAKYAILQDSNHGCVV